MKNRKVMQLMLCLTLSTTMAVGEPLMILAESDENIKISGTENVNMTSEEENSDEEMAEGVTYEEVSEAADNADVVKQVDEDFDVKNVPVPTSKVPSDLKDGTYRLPFYMFNKMMISEETTGEFGNPVTAALSMGNYTFKGNILKEKNIADVTVKNGVIYFSFEWEMGVGLTHFNWYDNKEDCDELRNPRGGRLEDTVEAIDDKNGITTEPTDDGAIFTYVPGALAQGEIANCITKITFPIPNTPTTNPLLYVEVASTGMPGAEQQAFMGFYWDELETVTIDEDNVQDETFEISVENSEGGQISVDRTEAKAGEEVELHVDMMDGYDLDNISVKQNSENVSVNKKEKNLYAFIMPEGDVVIEGVFIKNTDGDNEDIGKLPNPNINLNVKDPNVNEIKDEVTKDFYNLKNYVMHMNPKKYYLQNDKWQVIAGTFTSKALNEKYNEIRRFFTDEEVKIRRSGGIVPEVYQEDNKYATNENYKNEIKEKLAEFDALLADPTMFGEIHDLTKKENVIYPGGTFEVPVKICLADEKGKTVKTPLGKDKEVIESTENEHGPATVQEIKNATVTWAYDEEYKNSVFKIDFPFHECMEDDEDEEHLRSYSLHNMDNPNIVYGSTGYGYGDGTTIKSYAPYKTFYLDYSYEYWGDNDEDALTDEEDAVCALTLDWDHAKDISEEGTKIDKTRLKYYVDSINNRVNRDMQGNGMVDVYPKSVSAGIISSGLYDKAKAVLKNDSATASEVMEMIQEIEMVYTRHNTYFGIIKYFQFDVETLDVKDYTKTSLERLKKYADLSYLLKAFDNYVTPGGKLITTDQTFINNKPIYIYSEEEREFIGLKKDDGTLYSTKLEDGDAIVEQLFVKQFSGQGTAQQYKHMYERYFELKKELVSLKDLRTEVENARAITNDLGTYTEESFKQFKENVESVATLLDKEDATKSEIANAIAHIRIFKKDLVVIYEAPTEIEIKADDGKKLKVLGAFSEGASLSAIKLDEEKQKEILGNVEEGRKAIASYDIALKGHLKEGEEAEIRIPLKKAYSRLIIKHYHEGELVETLLDTDGNAFANIKTKSFSPFIVLAQESAENLGKTIKEAKGKDKKIYTPVSYKKLTEAIEQAERVMKNAGASEENIKDAQEKLDKALKALKKKADLTKLKKAIKEAEEILKEADKYTAASMKVYKAELENAKKKLGRENIAQKEVDEALKMLEEARMNLVESSSENLDKNALKDGVYTVSVNLWHQKQDKPSMGNAALYHTAELKVVDGKYLLKIGGHGMSQNGQVGEIDRFRMITNGAKPNADDSNYTEYTIHKDGNDCYIEVDIDNPTDVSEYYYTSIIVHTVRPDGSLAYPMGKDWVGSRLRISWDSLSVKADAKDFPAFKAVDEKTGVSVSAKEGALPKDTLLRVEKLDGKVDAIEGKGKNYVPYKISLYRLVDGKEVAVVPNNNMEIEVTLPMPEDIDKFKTVCYFVDASGQVKEIKGLIKEGKYVVVGSGSGTYAVAEKIGPEATWEPDDKEKQFDTGTDKTPGGEIDDKSHGQTGNKPGGQTRKVPGRKPGIAQRGKSGSIGRVKTGDAMNVAARMMSVMASLTALAGAVVLKKRRKEEDDI